MCVLGEEGCSQVLMGVLWMAEILLISVGRKVRSDEGIAKNNPDVLLFGKYTYHKSNWSNYDLRFMFNQLASFLSKHFMDFVYDS